MTKGLLCFPVDHVDVSYKVLPQLLSKNNLLPRFTRSKMSSTGDMKKVGTASLFLPNFIHNFPLLLFVP